MSEDQAGAEHQHGTVDEFEVRVEQRDGGWAVIRVADGDASVVTTHPDEESARREAGLLEAAATRYEGSARVEDVPEGYPGKGVDER